MVDRLHTDTGLVLRPWRQDDADAVIAAFASDDMARQAAEPVTAPEAAGRWLWARQQEWARGSGFSWAVLDPDGTPVANVAVTEVNRRHDTGWVSYWTAPAARGRGVAAAATRAVADWAFDGLGLFRLELGHRTNNPASCAVAHRAGFRVEGLERAKLRYDDRRYDVELHARLATDEFAPPGRSSLGGHNRRGTT